MAARKPSLSYMADGRKLINGQVQSSISPNTLWQDTLIKGQLIHSMSDPKLTDHFDETDKPKESCSPGADKKDTLEVQSSSAKSAQSRDNLSEVQHRR
uniref:Uncharacterized protein n=1 Tax=Plectus sambesii TaxID=2011161 RepID=A0A914V1W2_9BILA